MKSDINFEKKMVIIRNELNRIRSEGIRICIENIE